MYFPRLLLVLTLVGLTGCGSVSDAWMTGWTASEANDRIMLVRSEPMSFGFHRLTRQARLYPDLSRFVSTHGLPGFIAEMENRGRHFLILYYLDTREAFACRTRGAASREIEFAGPYPITLREFRILNGFRRQAESARKHD